MNMTTFSTKHKLLAASTVTGIICLTLLVLAYTPHLSAHQDQLFDVCLQVLKVGVSTFLKLLAQE
jgi:hypothetical protein